MKLINYRTCRSIWGAGDFDWAYRPSEGNSRGILTIWDATKFKKISEWSSREILVFNGRWIV
ncbi:hypothetical protein ACS0TY_006537 [Phlomoides rotata]